MAKNSSRPVGRHFLQIPGPTPVPDRVLRAMDTPIIDHRGPEFSKLAKKCLEGIKTIFKTTNPVIIYTATGTGAWEAALVNTLSPGDKVLMVETGQFATLWKKMAEKLGLKPEFITTDWRNGADPKAIEAQAARRQEQRDQGGLRPAQRDLDRRADADRRNPQGDRCRRPSGAADGRHHLLARLGRLSPRRMGRRRLRRRRAEGPDAAARHVVQRRQRQGARRQQDLEAAEVVLRLGRHAGHEQAVGFFPYTPGTQMLHGLAVGIDMLHEEGLDNVFARHDRLAEATRRAVKAWGLENLNKNASQYSPTITAILLPEGHDADKFRALALENFNISYGASFGAYAGKYFRIGHLGDINDGTLIGALGITEMALQLAGVPIKKGGVQAAMDYLVSAHGASAKQAAE